MRVVSSDETFGGGWNALGNSGIARLSFVLGKPPRPSTVIAAALDLLASSGVDVDVHLPHESSETLATSLRASDLVVQRGLRRHALRQLLGVETSGTRCCNPITATLAASDRLTVVEALAGAGVDVPVTRLVETWAEVRDAAVADAVVVKCRDGGPGRGAGVAVVLDGGLPPTPTFPGPWLVQELVPGDGQIRKLYVVGDDVRGLLKSSVAAAGPHDVGSFTPSSGMADLAMRAGAALRLDIYGVDVIVGPDGPRIIDVNPFPGLRGVPGAAGLVAHHVRHLADVAGGR